MRLALLVGALSLLLLAACSNLIVRPIAGYEHVSSISQHFTADPTNYACDQVLAGLRVRTRDARFQLDFTEGWSPEGLDANTPAMHALSEARFTVELVR